MAISSEYMYNSKLLADDSINKWANLQHNYNKLDDSTNKS